MATRFVWIRKLQQGEKVKNVFYHLIFIKSDGQLYDSILPCAALIRISNRSIFLAYFTYSFILFKKFNNMKLKATHSISNF